MKIQKLLNTAMLGAFFLLMMTVSAEEVALRVYAESKCREVCSLTANCRYYSYSEKNTKWIVIGNKFFFERFYDREMEKADDVGSNDVAEQLLSHALLAVQSN